MNDSEREDWVSNDEGLYDTWKASGQGLTQWVRANRTLIDAVVGTVRSGKKPAHYLKYGG